MSAQLGKSLNVPSFLTLYIEHEGREDGPYSELSERFWSRCQSRHQFLRVRSRRSVDLMDLTEQKGATG
jgi:hypothetical protein